MIESDVLHLPLRVIARFSALELKSSHVVVHFIDVIGAITPEPLDGSSAWLLPEFQGKRVIFDVTALGNVKMMKKQTRPLNCYRSILHHNIFSNSFR